jgi:hypothetical protein
MATRLLGSERRSISASRVIAAPPHAVFEAMQRIFSLPPYFLELRDSIGGDPLEGGILVFATPSYFLHTSEFSLDIAYSDLKELQISLRAVRPAGADAQSTEVTISSSMNYNRRLNVLLGGSVTGAAGVGGGAAAGAIAVAAGAAGVVVALPVVAGAAAGVTLFGAAIRSLYRFGVRRGQRAIDRLIGALALNTRTRGAFAQPPPPTTDLG